VPAQIAVLLALTAGLFDDVALDRMTDAEQAVRKAAAEVPLQVSERLDSADTLSNEDRETIIDIARKALARFQPKADSLSQPGAGTNPGEAS
jgi:F-type H+-transporting ATPase subunit alpha